MEVFEFTRRGPGIPASRVCREANQNQSRSFTWMAWRNKERRNFYLPIKKRGKKRRRRKVARRVARLPRRTPSRLNFTENRSFQTQLITLRKNSLFFSLPLLLLHIYARCSITPKEITVSTSVSSPEFAPFEDNVNATAFDGCHYGTFKLNALDGNCFYFRIRFINVFLDF